MKKSESKHNILEKHISILLTVIIICQLFVISIFGTLKESYHIDEVFTFGLSNSYYKPFILWNEEQNSSNNIEFYLDYLTVQADERFAFDSVYYNQVNDVHPPLYYYGIHAICSLFLNLFSKWIGIVFNMFFFVGTIILLYFLSMLIFEDKLLAIIICVAYGFSAGAISYTIFIRMYMMVTFFIITTSFLHGILIENQGSHRKGFINIAIIAINVLGFLTQYLYIIYAFFIAFFYVIYLFKLKKWKDIKFYILGMIIFISTSLILFPESLIHIFAGYRGVEAIKSFNVMDDILIRIWSLTLLLSRYIVLLPITIIIILTARPFYVKYNKNSDVSTIHEEINKYFNLYVDKKNIFIILLFSTLLTYLLLVKIIPYNEARYFAYLFPNIILILIFLVYIYLLAIFRNRNKVLKFLSSIICICYIFSYIFGGVEYLFVNKINNFEDTMSKYYNYNAYCISSDISFNTVVIPVIMNHSSSLYVTEKNDIIDILNRDNISEPIVLYFPGWEHEGNKSDLEVLQNIVKNSEYNTYKQLFTKEESGIYTNIYIVK